MTATKSSARTRAASKSIAITSERVVTDPTIPPAKSSMHASGRSSNGSHPTTVSTNPSSSSSGGSSNGAQPTIPDAKPNPETSAAPKFKVQASLRAFFSEHPELTTRDEIVSAYVTHLTDSEARDVLYVALRRFVYELLSNGQRHSWHAAERNGEGKSSGFAKWDAIHEAVKDGSLDRYRRIVDVEFMLDAQRVRFGSMNITQVATLVGIRQLQEDAIHKQRERLLRIHEQMRVTGAQTVEDLNQKWLTKEWDDA
jgi:hypothetical protein